MFDKLKFRELLIKAMGAMNGVEFAEKSGVNRTYISKYLTESLEIAPSPRIIRKLTNASSGAVTYEEMMSVAGHITNDVVKDVVPNSLTAIMRIAKSQGVPDEKLVAALVDFLSKELGNN